MLEINELNCVALESFHSTPRKHSQKRFPALQGLANCDITGLKGNSMRCHLYYIRELGVTD